MRKAFLNVAFVGLLSQFALSTPVARDVTVANVEAAYRQLQTWYNRDTGIWSGQWWHSGNAVNILADLAAIDSNLKPSIVGVLNNTFVKAQGTASGFLNGYYDDEGWWAHGWVRAYDVTRRPKYLRMAQSIYADMYMVFGSTDCSHNGGGVGGIWWDRQRTYVNAIANELFLSLAAHLANRVPASQKPSYLTTAKDQLSWLLATGMLNNDNNRLFNDGLTPQTCQNNNRTIWSYNQAVILGGLVELAKATSNTTYITLAQQIADAAIAYLAPTGILRETCETTNNCDNDQAQFKGIFARNLRKLQVAMPQARYAAFLDANANSIWQNDRSPDGRKLGLRWTGPFQGPADMIKHSSAMECLIASLAT